MKKFLKDLYESLKNGPLGFSLKKVIAVTITFCIVAAHVKWWRGGDFTLLPTILGLDFGFLLTLLGINVADKKINPEQPKTKEEELN